MRMRLVSVTDTSRTATFLTELSLYRLIGMSRKPFARPFQKWVAKMMKELRLNGKYEFERHLAEVEVLHAGAIEANKAEATRALEVVKAEAAEALEAATAKVEEATRLVSDREEELRRYKTKTYEEVPKLDHVYINKENAELSSPNHKIGKTINPSKREAQLNTGSAQGSRIIYQRATLNAKVIEDIVHVAQRRYHVGTIGGVEHAVNNVIDVARMDWCQADQRAYKDII